MRVLYEGLALVYVYNGLKTICKYCNTAKGMTIIDSNLMDGEGISISLDAKTGGGYRWY